MDNIPSPSIKEQSQRLTAEIYKALGFTQNAWYSHLLNPVFQGPAHRLSQIAAEFDDIIRLHSFQDAARWVLPNFIDNYQVRGIESIPLEGPLLVAANHPGAADTICHAASIPRKDLMIISSNVPFLRAMPGLSKHMIPVTRDPYVGMGALRVGLRHLQNGGALLLFSTSKIDADISIHPFSQAREELAAWSGSLEIFLSRVPQVQVVLAITSGVMARSCWRNPLKYLRKTPLERRRIAEFLQVMLQMGWGWKFNLNARVSYARQSGLDSLEKDSLVDEVKKRAEALLIDHQAALKDEAAVHFRPLK